jgi:SAM-dependent methyltransferase
MTDAAHADLPSPFVVRWVDALAETFGGAPRALDVAMGRGRHALILARAGYRTFGVDRSVEALRDARARASAAGLALHVWCADLTRGRLPAAQFDVIVVTRYLQRDRRDELIAALRPNGVLIYETFTIHQRALGTGPTSPDHLLAPGELRRLFGGLETMFYEEVLRPDAVARLVARRLSVS